MRTILVASALLAMMTIAPMATAVHGSAYTAHGIGIRDGVAYDALVRWTGYWSATGEPFQSYSVVLTDASTGDIVLNSGFFPGGWTANCWCYSGTEFFFPYHGYSTQVGLFNIYGIQTIHIATGSQFMVYAGNYADVTLSLIVDDYAA